MRRGRARTQTASVPPASGHSQRAATLSRVTELLSPVHPERSEIPSTALRNRCASAQTRRTALMDGRIARSVPGLPQHRCVERRIRGSTRTGRRGRLDTTRALFTQAHWRTDTVQTWSWAPCRLSRDSTFCVFSRRQGHNAQDRPPTVAVHVLSKNREARRPSGPTRSWNLVTATIVYRYEIWDKNMLINIDKKYIYIYKTRIQNASVEQPFQVSFEFY